VRTCPVYNFTCFGADHKGYVPAPMYYTNGAAGRSLTAITFTQSYEAANNITDPFFPLPANSPVYQYTTNSIYGAPLPYPCTLYIQPHPLPALACPCASGACAVSRRYEMQGGRGCCC